MLVDEINICAKNKEGKNVSKTWASEKLPSNYLVSHNGDTYPIKSLLLLELIDVTHKVENIQNKDTIITKLFFFLFSFF